MVLGATFADLARHHDHPFHAIEGIEEQFMLLFFVRAGASLELHMAREPAAKRWMGVATRRSV